MNTCSFCSVSSLSEAERVSRLSPLRPGVGLLDVEPLTDGRRVTDEFNEEETRGALAAERAVAPFAMEFGGEAEGEEGERRADGGVALEVVVAMKPQVRNKIVDRSSRMSYIKEDCLRELQTKEKCSYVYEQLEPCKMQVSLLSIRTLRLDHATSCIPHMA